MNQYKSIKHTLVTAMVASFAIGAASSAIAADKDYGEPGEPIHLVVGYQPYYTQSWSGVVMNAQELWKKYLPEGSTVEFAIGLQGAIVVNNMLAGKNDIGYMGDMPAIVATTKQEVADIRIVATLGTGWDMCNVFLVRNDAPEFADDQEALKWLDGKVVAVPQGSCTDRFARSVFQKMDIEPEAYLNQNIEVITSGFRAQKLDAAVMWEPTTSRLVEEGLARRIASGASADENDGGFLAMRADLINQRPDVVKGWLEAELDAQLFLSDPANTMAVVEMAQNQTTGFTEKVMWMSLVGSFPESQGGVEVRDYKEYTITPRAQELLDRATKFLHTIKSINTDTLRPEAVMPEFTQEILKERGLEAPIGEIRAQPESAYTGS
jgi:NitT/TauT family transport system substrate-binding protein